jgi:hypothetical protein
MQLPSPTLQSLMIWSLLLVRLIQRPLLQGLVQSVPQEVTLMRQILMLTSRLCSLMRQRPMVYCVL